MSVILPGIPDVTGKYIIEDPQLRELMLAMKVTLELIRGSTVTDFNDLVNQMADTITFNDVIIEGDIISGGSLEDQVMAYYFGVIQ